MLVKIDNKPDNYITPLELLNLYYSDGKNIGNRNNRIWRKMNSLLSWDNLLNHNYQTDLCPLLYFIITKALPGLKCDRTSKKMSTDIIPNTILTRLQHHYRNSLRRNMILLNELKKVVQVLQCHNIQVIVLKGGYLAENAYENIACRPMGDLDILIQDKDRDRCYKIMHGMGYRMIPANFKNTLLHQVFFMSLMGEQIKIEIHHRLAKKYFMATFQMQELWRKGYMPLEYLFVYVAWHSIHHGVARLIWICDIAEIIRNNKLIQWDVLFKKSEVFNIKKQVILQICLTANILIQTLLNNEKIKFCKSIPYLTEILLLRIQKEISNRKKYDGLRHLLSIFLMKKVDIVRSVWFYYFYKNLVISQ